MAGQASGPMAGEPAGEWHDWVGELFEPAFGSTIDDLLGQETEDVQKPKVKHVSVHDPDAVKRVYEKVRVMTIMDEEMRKQRATKSSLSQRGAKQDKTSPPVERLGGDKTPRRLIQDMLQEDEDKKSKKILVDPDESCIWDSEEIAVLREAFKSVKQQNIDASVHVRLTVQRNEELEALCAKQQKTIEAYREKFTKVRNMNRRLKLNVDSLNEEVKYLTAKVGAMEEVLAELTKEKTSMVAELHDNRVEADKERMARERIQVKLDCLKQEAVAEKLSVEENVRTMCRKTILDQQAMVKKLERELTEERGRRSATEKGLKHLRSHFSSLPVRDILPPGVVCKDEVSRVQY